jgi:hypothetical protein
MTRDEFKQLRARRRSRYGIGRTRCTDAAYPEINGQIFDSREELAYAKLLVCMERTGQITQLVIKPVVDLTAGITWRVDFSYLWTPESAPIYDEYKGIETEPYKLKKKLWSVYGPGLLRIVKSRDGGRTFKAVEVIAPVVKDD